MDWMKLVQLGIVPLLSGTGALVVGYFWGQSIILRAGQDMLKRLGTSQSVSTVLGISGTLILRPWNATATPLAGLGWTTGFILGTWWAFTRARNALVDSLAEQSGHQDRKRIERFASTNIMRYGIEGAEERTLAWLKRDLGDDTSAKASLALLHNFIHAVRNRAVTDFADLESELRALYSSGKASSPTLNRYLDFVLAEYVTLLAALTKQPEGLWVAVRTLVDDENGRPVYRTIKRAGNVDNNERDKLTRDIPADAGFPRYLEANLNGSGDKKTRGVVFIRPSDKRRGSDRWMVVPNDELNEDRFVMAAPITIRSVSADGSLACEMAMILYANHDKDVFFSWHRDIVRSCVDALSLSFSFVMQLVRRAQPPQLGATIRAPRTLFPAPNRIQAISNVDNGGRDAAEKP